MLRVFLPILLSSSLLLFCGDRGLTSTDSDSDDSNSPARVSSEEGIYATYCGGPTGDVYLYECYRLTAAVWEGTPSGGMAVPGASISLYFMHDGVDYVYRTTEKTTDEYGWAQWEVLFTFGLGHYTIEAVGRTAEGEFFSDYDPKWITVWSAPRPPWWMSRNDVAKRSFTGKHFKEGLFEKQK